MLDTVQIVETAKTPTAVVTAVTSWEAFPQLWGELLGEVWAHLRGSGLSTGRNVMLFTDDLPHVEVGAEVGSWFDANGRVVPSTLPGGRAARAVARGAPSPALLAGAHAVVREWCAAHGYPLTGVRWEVYGHWLEDQDPAVYETEVFWQLQPTR
jgi:effector-binding domain-containing protein